MAVAGMKNKFEEKLGAIRYKISYEEQTQNLNITVVECRDLKKMDVGPFAKSDPFVRVFLMPGQHKELKTKMIKKNLNPQFNEVFKFVIPMAEVTKKTVVLQVYDWDKISAADGMGEVQIPLWQLNLAVTVDEWKSLHNVTGSKGQPILKHSGRPTTAAGNRSTTGFNSSSTSLPRYSTDSMRDGPALPPTSPPKRRSKSSSSSSDDEQKVSGRGPSLKYKLHYEDATQELVLTVVDCKDLKKGGFMDSAPDPVVSIYVLPGSHKELKTKMVKNNRNPTFNEQFKFGMPLNQMTQRSIILQVHDHDKFSKNDPIGEVQIQLGQVDFRNGKAARRLLQPITNKVPRKPSKSSDDEKRSSSSGRPPAHQATSPARKPPAHPSSTSGPSLHYKLHYDHSAKNLVVTIVEAKNLPKGTDLMGGKPDGVVECSLVPGAGQEFKTKVVKGNNNPVFNEEFQLKMALTEASEKTLVMRVFDWDRLSKNDPIGEIQVPLWQVDFSTITEDVKSLGKVTAKAPTPKQRKSRSRSRSSSSSSDEETKKNPEYLGRLQYRINYESVSQTLVLTVIKCKSLKKADLMGSAPDPMVLVNLSPAGGKELKTKVVKNTQHPVFNDTFRISVADLFGQTLILQVFDWDRVSKNDPLGEVHIPLGHRDITKPTTEWKQIQKYTGKVSGGAPSVSGRPSSSGSVSSSSGRPSSNGGPPALRFQIVYHKDSQSLNISVIECRNLKKADLMGKPDAVVNVHVLPSFDKESKTKVVKNSTNPVFNENFRFQVPYNEVARNTLTFQIFDWDRFSKNDGIGEVKVQLGSIDLGVTVNEWRNILPISGKPSAIDVPMSPSRPDAQPAHSSGPPATEQSINYRLEYDNMAQILAVTVLQCKNLNKADNFGGKPDAYVNVFTNPSVSGAKTVKTKTMKGQLHPVFNETFRLQVPASQIANTTLYLEVVDWDMISKNDPLGEVKIPLGHVNFSQSTNEWSLLQKITGRPSMGNYNGSQTESKRPPSKPSGPATIRYQVMYDGNEGLRVNIIQCQNLAKTDLMGGNSDAYVTVFLLPGNFKEQKTKVVKNNANPFFNENFIFKVPTVDIARKTVVLQIIDHDTFSKNDPIGEVQIPLWKINTNSTNDTTRNLEAFSGIKPVLREQPSLPSPAPQPTPSPVPPPAPARKSSSSSGSSSSSDDEEVKVSTDHLSLKELNELLLTYIDQVRYLEQQQEMNSDISITVDRTEIDSLHVTYASQVQEWRIRAEHAEAELAKSRSQMDGLQGLHREIAFLKGELEATGKARDQEKLHSSELERRLKSLEQELRDRIVILERELANEKGRSHVDISSIDTRIKGEYEKRLKAELKKLRKMYEEHMRGSQEEMMRSHAKQVTELEQALSHERSHNSSSGVEARELRIMVEELRRKITDLESSNHSLGRNASEMSVRLQDEAAAYQKQLAEKDREILELKRNIDDIRRKYQEIYGTSLEELAEIKVYGGLLRPEIDRITRFNVERERKRSRSRPVKGSKSRTRSRSSSSSSDEEKKKVNGRAGGMVGYREGESFI